MKKFCKVGRSWWSCRVFTLSGVGSPLFEMVKSHHGRASISVKTATSVSCVVSAGRESNTVPRTLATTWVVWEMQLVCWITLNNKADQRQCKVDEFWTSNATSVGSRRPEGWRCGILLCLKTNVSWGLNGLKASFILEMATEPCHVSCLYTCPRASHASPPRH